MSSTELEDALASVQIKNEQLPIALPLAHMTSNRRAANDNEQGGFEDILDAGILKPKACKVFGSSLLYFSYGGLFYSKANFQTQQAAEVPVGLVFDPGAFSVISQLFPFDSGAMFRGTFGNDWSVQFSPFQTRFSVNAKSKDQSEIYARQLVYHLFERNSQYISGVPKNEAANHHPTLQLLSKFLNANLSGPGVDHRQRTIEAISQVSVELGKHLIWAGWPLIDSDSRKKRLYEWTKPRMVPVHEYTYQLNFNPAMLASKLEQAAYDQVIKRYAEFPNER